MNLILLGILLAVGSVSFFLLPRETAPQMKIPAEQRTTETSSPRVSYQTDTDRDGMPDWEEKLRGTDPNTPDESKKEPLEIIARLEEKRLSTPPTQVRQASAVVPSAPATSEQKTVAPKTSSAETAALRAFGNALGTALAPIATDAFEREMLVRLDGAIESEEKVGALASIAAAYTAVSAALKETAAPPQSGGAALLSKLSASYEMLASAVASLARETASDPAQLGKAWLGYSDAVLEVGKALNETIGFFAERGISFSSGEPGTLFNTN